jgi:hypothetical protein
VTLCNFCCQKVKSVDNKGIAIEEFIMLLNTAQFHELVVDAFPLAKKYDLERELEMADYEVGAALIALERVLNKIAECEEIAKEAA